MSFDINQLGFYKKLKAELIPLHIWNKIIKDDERGKTPTDKDWLHEQYKQTEKQYKAWAEKGNIGYRIKENEIIVDLDPRNYNGKDIENLVADYFGFLDFDELVWELPVVKTGSGGYHIYCTLPEGTNYKLLSKAIKGIDGVDFKKKGGYVVAAGSRHPNGNYYIVENIAERVNLPDSLLKQVLRPEPTEKQKQSGYGALAGDQLKPLILDKLDIGDYSSNDEWEPILMACHHVTGGEGVDDFVAWCLTDNNYSSDEYKIRSRWESLDNSKDVSRTAASLIREINNKGEDTSNLKAVLEFSNKMDFTEVDEEDSEEAIMAKQVKTAVDGVDINDIIGIEEHNGGVKGQAIKHAKSLDKKSSFDDKMKCIRLIKAASMEEALEAQEILVNNRVMSQSSINKKVKALDVKILDSISEILANTTMETVFKNGKYIITEPNGQLWAFNKTHWLPVRDEYLGKMIYGVLDTLKSKIDVSGSEIILVNNAVRTVRMRSSLLTSRLFDTERYRPIINCINGEVWINKDGTHELKPHNYKSYQLRRLNVKYNPDATAPVFMKTLNEIFELYEDRDEIVRHLGEIMGYVIQPYKPDANWWMFRGPGGDGKSTIIKIINAILGDALYSADESLLCSGEGRGNSHATADLVGKLAVVIQELRAGKPLNDSGLKMLAENTKMTANPKNRDTFSFNYIGSLIMCCNAYPVIKDTSEGTVRRANIIPFNRQFVKHGEADNNRAEQILNNEDELAGVLNFMLEGYARYGKRGNFLPPESCEDAKAIWLEHANNVIRFVKENITIVDDPTTCGGAASTYYRRYERWCEEGGVNHKGRNNFYSDLHNLGITKRASSGNILKLYGCILKDEVIDDFEDETW